MSVALRPSWSIELTLSSRDALAQVTEQLEAGKLHLRKSRVPGGGGAEREPRDRGHFQLTVPPAAQRLWSPWLEVEITPRDAGSRLFARFSPHPSVWTGFAFAYLTLGFAMFVSLVIAGSGAMVKGAGQPWALWLAAILAVACGGLWGTASFDRGRAHLDVPVPRAQV